MVHHRNIMRCQKPYSRLGFCQAGTNLKILLEIGHNKDGFCNSVTCTNLVETVEHILIQCRAYSDCKRKLYSLWLSTTNPVVLELVLEALTSERCYFLQFILDCSVLPSVIAATQRHGFSVLKELFHFTRTWCFTIHRQRMKMLGRWNY